MTQDRKILFLDIDGVLNFIGSRVRDDGMYGMDPGCVARLRSVVEKHNAKIVISSMWRDRDDWREHITQEFSDVGWEDPPIIGRTPNLYVLPRGFEIQAWLKKHPAKNYVIVDDDADMLPWQWRHFVRTHIYDGGLTKAHADKIDDLWTEQEK
jgi:hypothetical protein